MLSYQWDHQAQVTRVYDMLTRLGITCWMDVKSGMGADIYEGMANAVSNACVVVCFMSEKYQQSANCMLEVKFAKQSGVGMIPVMMEGSGWRPSGWLGLITAGSLWVRLSDESQFEENIRQLYGQIQGMVGAALAVEEVSDEGVASRVRRRRSLSGCERILRRRLSRRLLGRLCWLIPQSLRRFLLACRSFHLASRALSRSVS